MDEFLNKLNLPFKLNRIDDDKYVSTLSNSDEWDNIYLVLENKNFLEFDETKSLNNLLDSHLVWNSDDGAFTVQLIANFEKDKYELIVINNNKEDLSNEKAG